jgi:hypothetical protein
MRNRMLVSLIVGIICLISGTGMLMFRAVPVNIPVTLIILGFVIIIIFIITRGGATIRDERDEMMKRIDILSRYHTYNATIFFLIPFSMIIGHFIPSRFSVYVFASTTMFFMLLTQLLIRFYLLKRGVGDELE